MLNDAPSDSWIFPVEVLRELICKFARSLLDNIRTLEIQSGAPTFVTEAICSLVNFMPALKELKISMTDPILVPHPIVPNPLLGMKIQRTLVPRNPNSA